MVTGFLVLIINKRRPINHLKYIQLIIWDLASGPRLPPPPCGLSHPVALHSAIVCLLCAPLLHTAIMTRSLATPVTLMTHMKGPTT